MSVTQQIKVDCVIKVISVTLSSKILLAVCVCVSCRSHFIRHALSAVSRKDLQRGCNNLFTRCQACLRYECHFQHLL